MRGFTHPALIPFLRNASRTERLRQRAPLRGGDLWAGDRSGNLLENRVRTIKLYL
jgi:hypothetical protein